MKGRMRKQDKQFVFIWLILAFALCVRYYDGELKNINGTMMAFHYGYGFISRGFIGTIYRLLDKLMPGSMYTYPMAMKFTQLMTLIFIAMLFFFLYTCMKKAEEKFFQPVMYVAVLFTIFAIPMFVSKYNFGRLDLYLVMLSFLGVFLLIKGKLEWLIVPISVLGIMIHQGYAFMYYNILLVMLFYKWISEEDSKKKKKYLMIFISSIVICCALFFWFEIFSHVNGEAIADDIIEKADNICRASPDGEYHKDVIAHEILGIDLTEAERPWQLINRVQLPIFLVMFLPYIVLVVLFFRHIWRRASGTKEKIKYLAVMAGPLTMLPEFILKVDYGRWVFAVVCYYCVVLLALSALGDQLILDGMACMREQMSRWFPMAAMLLLYAVLFQPCLDVCINNAVGDVAEYLNNQFLHLWDDSVYYR